MIIIIIIALITFVAVAAALDKFASSSLYFLPFGASQMSSQEICHYMES